MVEERDLFGAAVGVRSPGFYSCVSVVSLQSSGDGMGWSEVKALGGLRGSEKLVVDWKRWELTLVTAS